jgi:hypothetical protein
MEDFLRDVEWKLTDRERREAAHHLNRSQVLNQMPWVDVGQFVGRDRELSKLKSMLVARGATAPRFVLVEGLPGVGKSWLVARLLQTEPAIQERFRDGIIWASASEGLDDRDDRSPQEQIITSLVGQVFPNQQPQEDDLEWGPALRRRIRRALSDKSMLLVLDGVEHRIDLDEWMVVDSILGRLLITTRRTDLESRVWRERIRILPVEALDRKHSQELLVRGIETAEAGEPELTRLLGILGDLPLSLDIANRLARYDSGFGELMEQLDHGTVRSLEVTPPVCRGDSLKLTFQKSHRRLNERTARLFRALSVSPQPFDVVALSRVLGWNRVETGRRCRRLAQNGLIWAEKAGRYATHRLIHAYSRYLCRQQDASSLATWKVRFAAHYLGLTARASGLWKQGEESDALHLWRQIIAHVKRACQYAAEQNASHQIIYKLRSDSAADVAGGAEGGPGRRDGLVADLYLE